MLTLIAATFLTQTPKTELNILAAASLNDAFRGIARDFEKKNPNIKVSFSFAGSQTLATQINQGAPADLFASASAKNVKDVNYDPTSWRIFALNRLVIVTRKGYSGVRSVRDLPNAKRLVIAADAVPAGHYAEEFFAKAAKVYGSPWLMGVKSHIVSRELDVRSVLAKVGLGEADAGIVYVSDSVASKSPIGVISIPENLNLTARYPIVVPASAKNKDAAMSFSKFLFTTEAQNTLERFGFISPLRAVGALKVTIAGHTRTIRLPLGSVYDKIGVQAKDHGGKVRSFTGVPALQVLGKQGWSSANFVCGDDYSKTLTKAELESSNAIFMNQGDGNYGLVVPGHKPDAWVMWIREVHLK